MNQSRQQNPRLSLGPNRTRRDDIAEDDKGDFGLNILYEPQGSTIADLIFVHGLMGGSRSTWTKNGDPSTYWPGEWLPKDSGFQDVRIHAFGYNSNWKGESPLHIYDFAKALLASIRDSPHIPSNSSVPIIVVGHSMGGLVIKRMYILAKQKDEFSSIAHRVHAMMFLATPHRGPDIAGVLTRILNLSSGQGPFVRDEREVKEIHRNALISESINEEFPDYSGKLDLFSFFGIRPTDFGSETCMVVEKDLATMGYPNETTGYLDADHVGVCKYSHTKDPNYLIVRNALSTIMDRFRVHAITSMTDLDNEQKRLLDSFLGSSDEAEDDFVEIVNVRMHKSCEWILKKESYLEWQESPNTRFYWISAKPATGKTVLSGKVVSHLKGLNRDCSFYFFNHGDKAKSTIIAFLLSMARQMAADHSDVLTSVLRIARKDNQLRKMDFRTIWRVLYMETILKLKLVRTQYWVIDALDECPTGSELVPFLIRVMEELPVKIFLTSRDPFEVHKKGLPSTIKVVSEEISRNDTKSDIELYLTAHVDQLPQADDKDRQDVKELILNKSEGCFLWVTLVVQKLKQVHTSAGRRKVLEDVPSDMNELYSRIIDSMSEAALDEKRLAKAILTWTVCAARPLTIPELECALQLHLKVVVYNVQRAIESNCGQLVLIDKNSRVHVVHQTVRDFLIKTNKESYFRIEKSSGNKELAMACLEYLNGAEMRGPFRRMLNITHKVSERSPFVNYACTSFFDHLTQVSPKDDDVFKGLAVFLDSVSVFSWIEYIAQSCDLKILIKAGKSLKKYLQKRPKDWNPFDSQDKLFDTWHLMESWATDLIRLVTKFGKNLKTSPSSIQNLIPPFCPPESAPRMMFSKASPRGISLVGLSNKTWGDCLSTIIDPKEHFTALNCSSTLFAIGTDRGTIKIFNLTTCQEIQKFPSRHMLAVKMLRFSVNEEFLVSAGAKKIRVWETNSWTQKFEFSIPSQCLTFAFANDDTLLLVSLKNNNFMTWDLQSGKLKDCDNWTEGLETGTARSYYRPISASCNVEHCLLAVVYRGQDILLYDFASNRYETYTKEGGARSSFGRTVNGGALQVAFCKDPNLNLLAAAYLDGDLVVFDTYQGTVVAMALGNAQVLASSPDGRILAAGDSSGTISLYEFETLKFMYRIRSDDFGITSLKFSKDTGFLLDIRGSRCQVWDPMVLVRQDVEEEMSDTTSILTNIHELGSENIGEVVLITSLACHPGGEVFFCGKDDGSVHLYETKSGQKIRKLFSHADGTTIVSLLFDDRTRLLTSTDSSSRVIIHKLIGQGVNLEVVGFIFDHRAGVAVDQLLSNDGYTRILISSSTADTLWEISPDANFIVKTIPWDERGSYKWMAHPLYRDQLILLRNHVAHLYDWHTFQRLTPVEGIRLEGSTEKEVSIQSMIPCFGNDGVAVTLRESTNRHAKSKIYLWNAADFKPESETASTIPRYRVLDADIDHLIAADGQRLVFLHSDNWVCSTDPQSPSDLIRHFFLPADWLTSNADLIIEMTTSGDILVVKRDEVAIIKRGLENIEQGTNNMNGRRSPLGRRRWSGDSMPSTPIGAGGLLGNPWHTARAVFPGD